MPTWAKRNWQATGNTKPTPQDLDDLGNSIVTWGLSGAAVNSLAVNANGQRLENLYKLAMYTGGAGIDLNGNPITNPGIFDGNFGVGITAAKISSASTPHTRIARIHGSLHVGSNTQGVNDDGLIQLGGFNFVFGNNWSGLGGIGQNFAIKSTGSTDTSYTPLTHASLGYKAVRFDAAAIRMYVETGATTAGSNVNPTAKWVLDSGGKVWHKLPNAAGSAAVGTSLEAEDFEVSIIGANTDTLKTFWRKYTTGTTWGAAEWRIQRLVDVSLLGGVNFIGLGGTLLSGNAPMLTWDNTGVSAQIPQQSGGRFKVQAIQAPDSGNKVFEVVEWTNTVSLFSVNDSGSMFAQGHVQMQFGAWNAGHLIMGTFHLWMDGTGRLRQKNGAPTSDTDGTLVGAGI